MAKNFGLFSKCFPIFLKALAPFIASSLRNAYKMDWWNLAVMSELGATQKNYLHKRKIELKIKNTDLTATGSEKSKIKLLDVSLCLYLFEKHEDKIFRNILSKSRYDYESSWAGIINNYRHRFAHFLIDDFSDSDTHYALDIMARFCLLFDEKRSLEIRKFVPSKSYGSNKAENDSWDAMILVQNHCESKNFEDARSVFYDMDKLGTSETIKENRAIAAIILMSAYCTDNKPDAARAIFEASDGLDESENSKERRAVATANLIAAYREIGDPDAARVMFDTMSKLGNSETITLQRAKAAGNLTHAYGKAKRFKEARSFLNEMAKFGDSEDILILKICAASILITTYYQTGELERSLDEVRDIFDNDLVMHMSKSHDIQCIEAVYGITTCLIDAYCKVNKFNDAHYVFEFMKGDSEIIKYQRAVAATLLVLGYCNAGKPEEGSKIYSSMIKTDMGNSKPATEFREKIHVNIMNAYMTSGREDEAFAFANLAIQTEMGDPNIRLQDVVPEAIKHISKVAKKELVAPDKRLAKMRKKIDAQVFLATDGKIDDMSRHIYELLAAIGDEIEEEMPPPSTQKIQ